MRRMRTLIAVGAVAALAAACTNGGSDGLDLTGSWVLVQGTTPAGDIELIEENPVTLDITAGGATSGVSACNSYAGQVDIDGDVVSFGEIASTLMACEEHIMEVEAAFQSALRSVESGSRSDSQLVLSGPDVELTFSLVS